MVIFCDDLQLSTALYEISFQVVKSEDEINNMQAAQLRLLNVDLVHLFANIWIFHLLDLTANSFIADDGDFASDLILQFDLVHSEVSHHWYLV